MSRLARKRKSRERVREDRQTQTKDDRFDHIQTNSHGTKKEAPRETDSEANVKDGMDEIVSHHFLTIKKDG